ncbi:AAA family ATPase [Kitasatospora purpeofusca]|uniref:AAA family ATPase n=1 Tax=Kitasatospora purpeofusca TaxID=67352 RepID=UPI0035D73CC3
MTPHQDNPVEPGGLVVLIGPAGSGKTTFSSTRPENQVVELDTLRALVNGGDAGDQGATKDAVRIQNIVLDARLERGETLYLDSTNAEFAVRAYLVARARHYGRPTVAVAFTTPLDECLRRNAERPPARRVPEDEVSRQHRLIAEALPRLVGEGFDEVRLHSAADAENC